MFLTNPEKKWLIGMVHVGALPGTPRNRFSVEEIVEKAVQEASIYAEEGADAVMFENMHDRPYLKRQAGPEIVAAMARVCAEARNVLTLPLGLQVLAGANKEAMAIAHACGFQFIRAEGFVFGHLADEGMMESDAGELLRYRKQIGAEEVKIFADIKKKHSSHALTSDISLVETAKAAEFFLADAIVVTGRATGEPADAAEAEIVYKQSRLPVIIGSGINTNNLPLFWNYADGFIVGSSLKSGGVWENDVDRDRVAEMVKKFNQLRKQSYGI